MIGNEFLLKETWSKVIDKVRSTNQFSEAEMQFFASKLYDIDEEKAVVIVDNFSIYSIMNQHLQLLEDCLEEVCGKHFKIKIVTGEEINKTTISSIPENSILRGVDSNQKFTNFVVGKSNIQAQFAAMTCSANPGLVYNPLFIYGNSGLGKTHLLNSIGNKIIETFPNFKVGYTTGPEFIEGVAKATKDNTLDKFKSSFYDLDLLLIDDIQFIAGNKVKTHEVFFTIFNYLINNKKQVCITADRTPNEIKDLEERIITRFNQGLNVNVEAPEYETSINILKNEIETRLSETQSIDEDVYGFLASNFSNNIRDLKGAVVRLLFYAIEFSNEDHITLKLAIDAFKDQIKVNSNELTIKTIRKTVCDYYSLTTQQIISATRTKNIANARHIAIYLSRKLLDLPYDTIGQEFGKRDHTTIMASCDKVEKLIKSDPIYLKAINEIESKLKISNN